MARHSRCRPPTAKTFDSPDVLNSRQPCWCSFAVPGDRTAASNWSSLQTHITAISTLSGPRSSYRRQHAEKVATIPDSWPRLADPRRSGSLGDQALRGSIIGLGSRRSTSLGRPRFIIDRAQRHPLSISAEVSQIVRSRNVVAELQNCPSNQRHLPLWRALLQLALTSVIRHGGSARFFRQLAATDHATGLPIALYVATGHHNTRRRFVKKPAYVAHLAGLRGVYAVSQVFWGESLRRQTIRRQAGHNNCATTGCRPGNG